MAFRNLVLKKTTSKLPEKLDILIKTFETIVQRDSPIKTFSILFHNWKLENYELIVAHLHLTKNYIASTSLMCQIEPKNMKNFRFIELLLV